jgi:DNA polymerase III epsilon subunit-like protein
VDTETGGLDSEKASILSLGAVILEDGAIVDEFYVLINEGSTLVAEPAALKVNGLTIDQIKQDGTYPEEALNQFTKFLMRNYLPMSNVTLVGHNLQFDVGFIKRLFKHANKPALFNKIFSYKMIDTMQLIQVMRLADRVTIPSVSLNDSCAAYTITIRTEERHNATEDAKATAILLAKIIEEIKTKGDTPDF